MDVQTIYDYAEKKGLVVDYFTPVFDRWGEFTGNKKSYLGFEFQKNVYYWWNVHTYKNGEQYCSFDHRYNRNTGGIIKAVMTGIRAAVKIINFLEKQDEKNHN